MKNQYNMYNWRKLSDPMGQLLGSAPSEKLLSVQNREKWPVKNILLAG